MLSFTIKYYYISLFIYIIRQHIESHGTEVTALVERG